MTRLVEEALATLGFCTIAEAIAGVADLQAQVGDVIPPVLLHPGSRWRLEQALDHAGLPTVVLQAHPDVVVAEVLVERGHEVLVAVAPASAGGPPLAEVVAAHPAEVRAVAYTDDFNDLTLFNSAMLLVGVQRRGGGLAVPALAGLALERLGDRFPRRTALVLACTDDRPNGWTTVASSRIRRYIGSTTNETAS